MPLRRPSDTRQKIKSAAVLQRLLRQHRSRGRTIVFTNGCFDLLHAGHVALLEGAKRLGDVLVVALNSDRSVRLLHKGPSRPIVPQRDRARLLAAFASVDYVTVFNERTPQRLVELLRPDVLVKGADWGTTRIVGAETVKAWGGRVVRVPLVKGYSTTKLVARIKHAV